MRNMGNVCIYRWEKPNREVEFKFADPSPKRLLYDHKTSIDNFILPKYIESMQFIEFDLKSK